MKKLLLLCSFTLVVLFIYYSYLVKVRGFTRSDFDITVKMQDHISRRWDLPFSLLSLLGSLEITGVIWLGLLIFVLFKKYLTSFISLLLLPLALIIELYGKLFIFHPSPPFLFYRGVLPFHFPSSYVHTDYSYPSGHMTRTAYLVSFIGVWVLLRQKGLSKLLISCVLFIAILVMSASRIYLGEHWFSDVVGGTLLGTSLGILSGLAIPQSFLQKQESN